MGVGQRIIDGAAHVGGVIVVTGADRVRDVLVPVYRALDLPWDPATVGSLEDEIPGMTWERAADTVIESFGRRVDLQPAVLDDEVLEAAKELRTRHAVVW
jgi:octanoyl-[GcvH]:protein N-octanoyltransferase